GLTEASETAVLNANYLKARLAAGGGGKRLAIAFDRPCMREVVLSRRTKESLDGFADAVEEILAEAETDPDIAKNAPYSTPVRRLDEVRATRRPVVRQSFGAGTGDGGASA